jgi:membrane-bound lytic murein transglycosylase D
VFAVQAEAMQCHSCGDTADKETFSTLGLSDAVHFWCQVFTVWQRGQVALHDDQHLGIVYEVLTLPGEVGKDYTPEQRAYIEQRRKMLVRQLADLERQLQAARPLNAIQKALLTTIESGAGRHAVKRASHRLRRQRGMRERFLEGLAISGRYDKFIRAEFRQAGLPEDLAYLPHLESSFINRSRSSAGAVGVWQFMPGTGRRFLMMNRAVDERYDPVLAARGAASYLADAYTLLGDWGLAITSYNHGVGGMARAKALYGPDIAHIVHHYQGRRFGFASRNFYAEFLAVRLIMQHPTHYFPEGVHFEPPLEADRIQLKDAVRVAHLATAYGIKHHRLAEMNPAWTSAALRGRVALPHGSEVWLPKGATTTAAAAKHGHQSIILAQTDGSIDQSELSAGFRKASLHVGCSNGGTILAERKAREKTEPHMSTSKRVRATTASKHKSARKAHQAKGSEQLHLVSKGESPSHIAAKYGVSVSKLMAINDIRQATKLRPGQRLRIP